VVRLASIAAQVLERQGAQVLQDGATNGESGTRQALAAALFGPADGPSGVEPDDLVVTTGSQQGLELVARVLLDPGDPVVVGDPDYVGALQVLRSHGAALEPIPVDEHGLDTEVLERRLAVGLRPKACYLVPHFHNPTGVTIGEGRRRHLAALAARHGFLVIEDDPYRELFHDGPAPESAPESVLESADELTVRLRSTSKILAPGLRIGALTGPRWLVEAVVIAKQGVDLHTSTLCQALVAEAVTAPWFPGHLADLRDGYRAKRDALVAALRSNLGHRLELTPPGGGMFLWARFDGVDTAAWLERCLDAGVCFVPGPAFAVERDLGSWARLSFATATEGELDTAVARMAAALPRSARAASPRA
jgi:2-aminoadipate transaminase